MAQPTQSIARPNYGLERPDRIAGLLGGGVLSLLLGLAGWAFFPGPISSSIALILLVQSLVLLVLGLLLLWSSLVGRLRLRDQLLARLNLNGTEDLLDVGCGPGVLLIGAAQRLPQGRAYGVDNWVAVGPVLHHKHSILRNAQAAGVSERIALHDSDLRHLPFPPAAFDVVVSATVLHQATTATARTTILAEISRVLKPGARLALLAALTDTDATALHTSGFREISVSGPSFWVFPPLRLITAIKP